MNPIPEVAVAQDETVKVPSPKPYRAPELIALAISTSTEGGKAVNLPGETLPTVGS